MQLMNPHFYCQKVIPLVYDDSLSYYEQLCKLTMKMNEVITQLNTFNNNYIDEQIAELKSYVDTQDIKTLTDSNSYTDSKITELETLFTQQLQTLSDLLFKLTNDTRSWVAIQLELFKKEIVNIPLPPVINPLTGLLDSVQNTFNSFYEYLRCNAIDAKTFDGLHLTADEYDGKLIRAREFDIYSEKILVSTIIKMLSPFDGTMQPIQKIIIQLASLHQIGITALDYDSLEWTATSYDSKDLTAYAFDWLTVN